MRLTLRTRNRCKFLLLLALCSQSLFAQKTPQQVEESRQKILSDGKVKSVTISPTTQTPSFIAFDQGGAAYAKMQGRVLLEQYLQARTGTDYIMPGRETKVGNNMEVVEYQQYFKNIKVEHAIFKALVKDGQIRTFNGVWYDIPASVASQAKVDKGAALQFAKGKVGAKKYAADVIKEKISAAKNLRIKAELEKELADADPKGELVFVRDFTKAGIVTVKLAYKFNIYAAEPLSRAWIYVDAADGKILLSDAIIKHANPNPPAPSSLTTVKTRYAGSRSIYVKQISGNDPQSGQPITSSHPTSEPLFIPGSTTWTLMDDTRGGGVETYDMNGVGGLPLSLPSLYLQGKSFTDADNNWTVAEHKRSGGEQGAFEAENDDIAWDAHWGAEMVYDYWKINQGRLSYDGANAKIKSFIHYGPAYDNAFWNGSSMTYGDGSGTAAGGFRALTSLDVCGHEIGHGVCEFTANLIYEKESGAMNEAFSDIWAACIEHYTIKKIDPALAAIYRPFYIGEQIGATLDEPLRRMDNPKATGNPDTYGGTNWDNPDCAPDLTNDYCGVHNNSGLLNKWFYLITVGSGRGSGPDAVYARADSDDGINDAVSTNPVEGTHGANAYAVTGLGFTTSERISYLTELLLTPTSTYKEARAASIAVATELSGSSCSPIVESVTNAWYAIGVGPKFVKPCTLTYGFINQPGIATTEAATPAGCSSQKVINIPLLLPPGATATITTGGTAIKGSDYTLAATTLKNTTTTTAKQNLALTIINGGAAEADETVTLTAAITNVGANKVNTKYTLTILDDDMAPVIGSANKSLLSATFTQADGFAEPTGWAEIMEIKEGANGDPAALGKNQWGVFGGKLAITGKEGVTGTKLPNGNYNSLSESRTLARTPLLDARGLSLVTVKFDFRVQGEVDPAGANPSDPDPAQLPAFDYMAVAYSLDGVKFTELNTGVFGQFASAAPSTGTFQGTLPPSLANQRFYLAFRWSNDANAGGPESVTIDNLSITGAPRPIENTLNNSGRENLNAGQEIYFYSTQSGAVLSKLKNNSTKNFGCTNLSIEKGGTSAFTLYTASDGQHKVSSKILKVAPATGYVVSNTVTLYFSESQIKAVETATGKPRTQLSVYRVNATSYTGASSSTVKRYTPTYTAISGTGGSFTVTFTDYIKGSYALGAPVAATATSAIKAKEEKAVMSGSSQVYPNPVESSATYSIASAKAQMVTIAVINAQGQTVHTQRAQLQRGVTAVPLVVSKLLSGNYTVQVRSNDGTLLDSKGILKR